MSIRVDIVAPDYIGDRGSAVLVTEREVTLPDGTTVQAGTAADAGRICGGVKANTYGFYVARLGAPGPILVPESDDPSAPLVPLTGAEPSAAGRRYESLLYDMNAVRSWDRQRPGRGRFRDMESPESLRRTRLREAVLSDAEAGRLAVDLSTGQLVPDRLVAAPADPRKTAKTMTELRSLGLLADPDARGVVRLSEVGATVLARFRGGAGR